MMPASADHRMPNKYEHRNRTYVNSRYVYNHDSHSANNQDIQDNDTEMSIQMSAASKQHTQ